MLRPFYDIGEEVYTYRRYKGKKNVRVVKATVLAVGETHEVENGLITEVLVHIKHLGVRRRCGTVFKNQKDCEKYIQAKWGK